MADIEIRRAHSLGHAAARRAADQLAADLGKKFGLSGEWEGDELHFERPGVTGSLAITEKDLRLSVTLGLLLKALKPSIERAVVERLDAVLAAKKKAPAPKPKKAPARPRKGA